MAFNKGDVVVLKSGGVAMTVAGTGNYSGSGKAQDGVSCVWQEGAKVHRDVFDAAVLELAE